MTTSFATYASQFLTRQKPSGASSLTSSQPLFFSFSTDDDRSRAGHDAHDDLDDFDDPHLRRSDGEGMSTAATHRYAQRPPEDIDEDDPYLRLDEDDPRYSSSLHTKPLLASHAPSERNDETEPSRGWLAHQPTPLRTPSPSSTSSSSPSPPADLLTSPHRQVHAPRRSEPPLPPPPVSLSLQLTESLLPRDFNHPQALFSLPDPRFPAPRRKYHDALYTTLFLTAASVIFFFAILLLFLTHRPSQHPRTRIPYTTLLHTVPLLIILTFVSAAVSYAHIALLRIFVKPVVIGTSVFVPVTLLVSSIWAFVGSFMWDGDQPTWGETWGLRLFSLVPLALAVLTGRRLLHLPSQIHHTSSMLTLTTRLLTLNPFLLLLSPSVLLAFLLASIPFLTLAFRLLLIGYFTSVGSGWEWHVRGWANWAIAGTVAVWVWAWGVARGICRVSTAGVIAAWYFADPALPPPPPTSTHTLHAALYRATHPSFGSIAFAALLLTCVRALSLLAIGLRRAPLYLPPAMKIYAGPLLYGTGIAAGWIETWVGRFGRYVLIYVGVTGDGFWASVGRSSGLTSVDHTATGWRRRFQTEPPLTILTIAPLTLTLPFALSTYIFVAHTLNAPEQALEAAFLAGGVTALVGLFCVGLVKDVADTLYLCYCLDKEAGDQRRAEVFEMFEYNARHSTQPARSQPSARRPPPPPSRQAERRPSNTQYEQPPQPISRRVEGMVSPESSPEFGGRELAGPSSSSHHHARVPMHHAEPPPEEDLDPFLRAESPDEEDVEAGKGQSAGYALDMDDENASVSERSRSPPSQIQMQKSSGAGMNTSGRRGRDEEEGLGSGLGSMFPGSDIF
ncbi:plasma-membrane choline transporter-domain-containing protein [Amylostereum chailletii]|nr:plasma-membrane choline transporter-domain-containing protein [Amylostereum chailletii]